MLRLKTQVHGVKTLSQSVLANVLQMKQQATHNDFYYVAVEKLGKRYFLPKIANEEAKQ